MIRLLAIDTAAETIGVAVAVDGEIRAEHVEASAAQHSRRLFRMLDAVLEGAEVGKRELTHVAVTRGPGSFTGLRVGLAAAKGVAYALGVPLVGVSTLEAVLLGCLPFPGIVAPMFDARKHQVYAAAWSGEDLASRLPEGAWGPDALARSLGELPGPILAVGSGLGAYGALLEEVLGSRLLKADPSRWAVQPRQVARLGCREIEAGRAGPPGLLKPVYHRLSEAEEKKRRA